MNFWFWLIVIFLSLIFGGLLIFLFYGGFNALKDSLVVKRGIPKRKTRVSDYIKDHPDRFEGTNPGVPSEKDKKEVQDDERRRSDKYREFEKLRQRELSSRDGKTEQSKYYTPGIAEPPGNPVLSNVSNPRDETNSGRNTFPTRRVKLDE